MLTIACAKCGKVGRIPEAYMGHSVRCKACGSIFRAEPLPSPTPDEPGTSSPPETEKPNVAIPLTVEQQVRADVGNDASGDRCPYCMKIIDPPPKRSRRCPLCRERMVMRRHKLLTESQAAAFDLRLAESRAAREAALEAERERHACLPEGPISESQYREIIHRNAYIWSMARFENGRLILLPQQERESRLKYLSFYQTLWHTHLPNGRIDEHLTSVEDWDHITKLSYGVINLVTGLVAWRKEPKLYDSMDYMGDPDEIDARFRRLGEYYRTFEPPFP